MGKKLVLVGVGGVHTSNYLALIRDFFDEIVLVTQATGDSACMGVTQYAVDFSLKNPLNYVKAVRAFKRIVRKEKPDVIHIQQIGTHAFLLLKALGNSKKIPVVATAWGSDVLINPGKNIFYKKLVQYVLNHATAFTSDSAYMASVMRQLTDREIDITIANFGINIDTIPVKKENILYSNRLHNPLYRIDKIIAAFAKFVKNHNDWLLVIAGTGSETEKLKTQVEELQLGERVKFAGWVQKHENSEYYAKSRFWISIPESDATSVSLLEAMSLGAIPVLSDIPANREWIQDGKNGLIVSDIEDDFIEAALGIEEDSARKMNREIVDKYGTKEANREIFIKLYEKLNDNGKQES